MTTSPVATALASLTERVGNAAKRAGRSPSDIRVLLATKTVPAEIIRIAVERGFRLLGENRMQELRDKHGPLSGFSPEWHFIGHLQSNKVPDAVRFASCVESVDRLELAERLHRRLEAQYRTLDVLVQVNTSGETSKYGVMPNDALALVRRIATSCPRLRIRGLMTLARFSSDEMVVRPCFSILRQTAGQIRERAIESVGMDVLSMGMSHDFEWAIEEGATQVRVGTLVFGARQFSDAHYWPGAAS